MSRIGSLSPTRQLAALAAVAVVLGGAIFVMSTRASNAAESCQGLDTALQNNLNFIAGQKANPDAQSTARIANRQAVVDLIQQRRAAAGCNGNVQAQQPGQGAVNNGGAKQGSGESCAGLDTALQNNLNFIAGQKAKPDAQSAARIANRQAVVDLIQQRRAAAGCGNAGNAGAGNAGAGNAGNAGNAGGNGQQVCAGSTVTTNGLGGAPGIASGTFPLGTRLKVTNLDNNKSTTLSVTEVSGSCVLMNAAGFEQIREPGKFLIRRALIEKVG
jgi:hypothetical protein